MIAEIVSLILELLVTMFKIQILEREDQVGEGQDKGQLGADRYSEDLGEATSQETRNQGILSGAKMLAAQRQRLQKLQDSCASNQSVGLSKMPEDHSVPRSVSVSKLTVVLKNST